jgi:LuxR family transcriptional regulator, regulator of acetate metabolism
MMGGWEGRCGRIRLPEGMIEELFPERMEWLRRVTGVPVVLGGTTRQGPGGMRLVLDRVIGTFGDSLIGLTIAPGKGLGGRVLCRRIPLRVHDYATAMAITHDFDDYSWGSNG